MRQILFFLILLTAGFTAGFGAARWKALELISAKVTASKLPHRTPEFRATQYPLENRPFCLVVVGRNNGANLEKTLESVFSQNYENFRIIYIDDGSDDGSEDLARDLIYASPCFTKIQFHQNVKPLGMLASTTHAVRGCSDEEIVVVLNGDDWLAHEWVLTRLNQYYADPDLWLTFGQSRDYPTYAKGNARAFQEIGKPLRAQVFAATHLKTFYASLFKKINEADLQYKGEYFQGAADLAYMFPMLEMAQGHSQCLHDILYICNRNALKTEDREIHAFCEKQIRSLSPYERVL
jgi:glycosyltransferase involved in cell wall biosynthesis